MISAEEAREISYRKTEIEEAEEKIRAACEARHTVASLPYEASKETYEELENCGYTVFTDHLKHTFIRWYR